MDGTVVFHLNIASSTQQVVTGCWRNQILI